MAFPHKAITSNEEPKVVHFPSPLIAKGQIPAYIKEFGIPKSTTHQIDKLNGRRTTKIDKTSPDTVHITSAFC